jgi:hypothetical protein
MEFGVNSLKRILAVARGEVMPRQLCISKLSARDFCPTLKKSSARLNLVDRCNFATCSSVKPNLKAP